MEPLVHEIPVWALIPFILMLLGIAVMPLITEHWWERNRNKMIVSIVLGVPTAIWLLANGMAEELEHQMVYDYLPFIILLMALFVVTGGIKVKGDIEAKPIVNTIFLAIGWLLASIMGTTGAAMLLIRPLLTTNQQRKYKTHTVLFFIAVVANCGGLLTPLGDPPLFLLYLRGASFEWFLQLFPIWLFVGVSLLCIYYFVDSYYYKREPKECIEADRSQVSAISFDGKINLLWLICIMAAVAFINPSTIPAMADDEAAGYHAPMIMKLLREIALITIIAISWVTTKHSVRKANNFMWAPIMEVAYLFIGIFATMTPALMYLNSHAASMGLDSPWQFFYCTGALSSFLDNAPTAVAFHTVAKGLSTDPTAVGLVAGVPQIMLEAIATGAVFFGAMTYIGNGPNFMVKSIAEKEGVKMPSFFSYMLKFSLIVLLPIYIIAQLIFYLA